MTTKKPSAKSALQEKMQKFSQAAAKPASGEEMKKAQSVIGYDSNYIEMDVPIAQVYRDPNQPRPEQDVLDGLQEFADRLEAGNFVLAQLPLYYGFPDGTFQIIAGECRTEAFKLKGREFIKARVLKVPSKEIDQRKTLDLQWAENNDRKDLSMWADATFFKRYIDTYYNGKVPSDEECLKTFGRSQRIIYTFLKLTKLDAPVMALCKALKIDSAKNAEIIQACFNRVGESEFSTIADEYLAIDEDERLAIKVFFRPLSLNAVSKTENTSTSPVLNAVSKTENTSTSPVLNAVSKTEDTGTSPVLNAVSKIENEATIAGLDTTIKDVLLPLSGAIKKGIGRVDKDFKVMSQLQGNHDLTGIIKTLKEMKTDISNMLDYINDHKKGAK